MKRATFWVAVIFVLGGCQSTPTVYYSEASVDPSTSFSLKGSKVIPENWMFAHEISYVFAIDGLPVKGGKRRFDEAVQVPLGVHTIQIGFNQSNINTQVTFEVSVSEPIALIARSQLINKKDSARIWLENADTGEVFKPAVVGKMSKNTLLIVPI